LAGEKDSKFADIGARMASTLPQAMLHIIPGAGHNIHLEKPQQFASSVTDFLSQARAAAPN
jgi:pimeloyl-ACP methyl ester carboxylesterase